MAKLRKERDHRVQISGPRVRLQMEARGLSFGAVVRALNDNKLARISVPGLSKLVAAPGILTTRASVRRGLCVVFGGIHEPWLAGIGDDMSLEGAIANELADPSLFYMVGDKRGPWPDYHTGMRKAIRDLIDLDSWRRLLGPELGRSATPEEKKRFALAARDFLQVILAQEPSVGIKRVVSKPVHPEGFAELRKLLDSPPPRANEPRSTASLPPASNTD